MDIDFAELASLVALLKESDFSEFRYEKGDVRIQVRRGSLDDECEKPATSVGSVPATVAMAAQSAPKRVIQSTSSKATESSATLDVVDANALVITAPMLGTFYASPKPGDAPFVQIGDRVEPDTVLCIVEVMKLMNSVHAGVHGTVVAVHARNGDLVEFGQRLFSIQEDAS